MSKYIHPSRSRLQNSFNSSFRTDSDSDDEYRPPKLSSFASISLARKESYNTSNDANDHNNNNYNANNSSFVSFNGFGSDINGSGIDGFIFRTNRLQPESEVPMNVNISTLSQTLNSCPTSVFEEPSVRSTNNGNNSNSKGNNNSSNQYDLNLNNDGNLSSSINTTGYHRPSSMTTLSTHTFKNQAIDSELGKYQGLHFAGLMQQKSAIGVASVPSDKINKDSEDLLKSEGLLSRSKDRRFKRLFNVNRRMRLGPARRATSLSSVDHCDGTNDNNNIPVEETHDEDNYKVDRPHISADIEPKTGISETPNEPPLRDYSSIDFNGLDPLQYLRKFNLPPGQLPYIRRAYFERCKEEQREALSKRRSVSRETALRHIINGDSECSISNKKPEARDLPPTNGIVLEKNNENYDLVSGREVDVSNQPLSLRPAYQRIEKSISSIMGDERVAPQNNLPEASSMKRREALANIDINSQKHEIKKFKPIGPEKLSAPETSAKHVEIWEPPTSSKKNNGTTRRNNTTTVNGTEYEKIELLGRGGSSKVYRVKKVGSNKIYALKQVLFDEFDQSTIDGFKGEIDLLQKLRAEKRVVHLFDYQMDQGLLYLVMECGDFDLAQILNQRRNLPFDAEFVRYYTRELLKCVKVVHDAGIVHSDLKPANFVVVRGILKIIDFGIADAVPDHTVNIYRNTQIGTPNYMAPETLVSLNYTDETRRTNKHNHQHHTWKVGKPSDIWSCGCIIYQMVYGRPPYASFSGQNRLFAIMNPEVKITYPEKAEGGETVPRSTLELIRACLRRDPSKRVTVDEALECSFLKPVMVSQSFIRDLIKSAVNFGIKQKFVSDEKLEELTNDVISKLEEIKM